MTVILAQSLGEYFQEALKDASKTTNIQMTDPAQVYLIQLLIQFARAEEAYAGIDRGERPSLVQLLERATASKRPEAIRLYKYLGDTSLYFISFFPQSAQRVTPSYYESMGETAYSSAAALQQHGLSAIVYQELSNRFGQVVLLLNCLKERSNPGLDFKKLAQ